MKNTNFRKIMYTGKFKLVLMCL